MPLKSTEDVLLNSSQYWHLAHLFISPVKYLAMGLREDHDPVSIGKFPLTWLNP